MPIVRAGRQDTSTFRLLSRTRGGAPKLSVVPGERGATAFYKRFGFEPTGVEQHGQVEMRLALTG